MKSRALIDPKPTRENVKVPREVLVCAEDASGNRSVKRITLDNFESAMQDEGPPEDPLAPAKGIAVGLAVSVVLAVFGFLCFWAGWWLGGKL